MRPPAPPRTESLPLPDYSGLVSGLLVYSNLSGAIPVRSSKDPLRDLRMRTVKGERHPLGIVRDPSPRQTQSLTENLGRSQRDVRSVRVFFLPSETQILEGETPSLKGV